MTFLLDPSLIIGYPSHSLTHSVTHCCLEDLIDVTLVCEDANSKLVEFINVAETVLMTVLWRFGS